MNPQIKTSNTQEQMFTIIEAYLSGAETQKQICQTYNISLSKFAYWLRKYRQNSSYTDSFLPISVKGAKPSVNTRIELPNGVNIVLNGSVESLSHLIQNLVEHHVSR